MNSILKVFILSLICYSSVHAQKLGKHTIEEWQTIIDTTWGEGLPTATKLNLFDAAWNRYNWEYAGFQNIDVDWQGLREKYRPEIEAGVSRGRFVAIMNHLALALHETHTWLDDKEINQNTALNPGVPLFVIGSFMNNSHFGASLTPLPDSSLMVFKVSPDHPLGLLPGDIVLGYEGIPWKILYKQLLAVQLPIHRPYMYGSSEQSMTHYLLISAGMNWHLFDTLDVVQYSTGDTLHFPTDLLEGQTDYIWGNEQMDIPGVPFPDIGGEDYFSFFDVLSLKDFISWGIIDGTQIGYIYVAGLVNNTQIPGSNVAKKFYNAVDSLMNYYNTSGLIIDDRFNIGGDYSEKNGLSLLFNSYIETAAFDKRCGDPNDHFQMCPSTWPPETASYSAIDGYPTSFYDKPIAFLTGPGALSAGDLFALRIRFHPMVRVFGKPTAGAFGVFTYQDLPGSDNWQLAITNRNGYLANNPGDYLCHTEVPVDEEVWLTQEDVGRGEDTVVKKAIEWIQNLAYAHDVSVNKSYAQPGIDTLIITAQVENPNAHTVSVNGIIRNADNSFTDNFELFDDGLHGDGLAADQLWGNYYLPDLEESFKISVTTEDITDQTSRTLPKVAWFTTKGPVAVDHYEITSSDTIPNPGDRPRVKLYLVNNGTSATVKNIEIKLKAIDSCSSPSVSSLSRTIDSLAAGEINTHNSTFTISLISDCTGLIPVRVDIYEGDYIFWVDTLYIDVIATGISDSKPDLPKKFALFQNYPNPFNPETMINYQLAMSGDVDLSIYNLLGQKVATLVDKKQAAGNYQVQWDAGGFASGVYLYRLQAGDFVQTKKLLLLK